MTLATLNMFSFSIHSFIAKLTIRWST